MRLGYLAFLALVSGLHIPLSAAQPPASDPVAPSQKPASEPATGPKQEAPSQKRASQKVDVKKECDVLEDVFRHRAAFHFLKNNKTAREAILKTIDTQSAGKVRLLVENEERFRELDYHFVEKINNCEQRILGRLRADKFQGVADLLEAVKARQYPTSPAFAELLSTVELNLRFAVRKGFVHDEDTLKELAPKLSAEVARVEGTAGHPMDEIATTIWKDTKPEDFPASWFDPSSEVISYEFGAVPEATGFPKVDLGTASREELLGVPRVEPEMADGILKYRKRSGFVGAEELRFVEEIPERLVDPLRTICKVTRGSAERTSEEGLDRTRVPQCRK